MNKYRDMNGIWVREPLPAELMAQYNFDIEEIDTSTLGSLTYTLKNLPDSKSLLHQWNDVVVTELGPMTTRKVCFAGFFSVVCTETTKAAAVLLSELHKLNRTQGVVVQSVFIRPSTMKCYSAPKPGENANAQCWFGPEDQRPAVRRTAAFCALHGYLYLPDAKPGDDPLLFTPDNLAKIGIRIGRNEGTLGVPDEFEPEPITGL
jgi:hypothetical protein